MKHKKKGLGRNDLLFFTAPFFDDFFLLVIFQLLCHLEERGEISIHQ